MGGYGIDTPQRRGRASLRGRPGAALAWSITTGKSPLVTPRLPSRRPSAKRLVLAVAGLGALALPALAGQPQAPDAAAVQAWRAQVTQKPLPQEGCFSAAYPSTDWVQTACRVAPNRPYVPAHGHRGYTVGNGNDYSAVVTGIISSAEGSFPMISGLRTETDNGRPNTYSLQANSQFFKTSVCNGATNPASCLGWQQFVYSNSGVAFMQYWLINYGNTCPAGGWMAYSGDCYRNSAGVSTPVQPLSQLGTLTITGTASRGGNDTLVFTSGDHAYSTSGKDTVVNLATAWNAVEYNVIGDGGGSQAKFNKGTSITVQIALQDGLTAAPTCQSKDGTTGETNNLNLGGCSASGGSTPLVLFTEHR